MKTNWKILKVFLSSTFKDLELTRDRLTNIFEKIERTILKRSLTIRPYDLRWRDRHSEEPIVEWCIRMVRQCDYFIGILGNRYGWRPPTKVGGQKNLSNISMTEMEIKESLLKIPRKNRFFCFTTFQDIEDETPEDIAAMDKLKKYLENKGENVFVCHTLDELLLHIEKTFTQIIDEQYPPDVIVTAEQLTRLEAIEEFIAEKLSGFVGREDDVKQLQNFVLDEEERSNYLVIQAVAGTGKSALIGKFIQSLQNHKIPLITHFLSIDGSAREVSEILFSLVDQLHSNKIIEEEPHGDLKSLRNQLQEGLENYQEKLVLVIDGIDEVEEDGQSLFWLPRNLPQNIRIIITTRPVETWHILRQYPFIKERELSVLQAKEISQIIENYMHKYSLEYNEQDKEMLQKNCAGNPLYLKVGLDELRASGTSVAQLAITVDSLFHQILNRLEDKYQKQFHATNVEISAKNFLEQYLGFIAAGRAGVLEKELQDILKIGDDLLLPISKSLSNFIITRNGFLNFFHPEFERTIKARIGKQKMRIMHQNLAQYFEKKGLDYIRTLDELPYQLQWSETYDKLLKLLTSLSFLERKAQRNLIQGLREDFRFALHGQVVSLPEDHSIKITPQITVNKNTVRLIQKAFEIDFHLLQSEPDNIFHCLWNRCYWHDCPEIQNYRNTTSQDNLYLLAEKWRQEIAPGKLWLRSLRPLQQRMDSPVENIFRGHKNAIHSIAIWKHKLASASKDHTIKIWDLKTEICLFTLRHRHQVNSVDWSSKGDKIVSASEDGQVIIWSAQSGEEITRLDHSHSVSSVEWSPDDKYIVSGARDGIIRVWDFESKEIVHSLEGHKGGIFSVSWNPKNNFLASSSKDKSICVWDLTQQKPIAVLQGHNDRVLSISWNHNGTLLASASYDSDVRIWDYEKEKCISILNNHENVVTDVCWHPHKDILASASEDKTIRVWNLNEQEFCLKSLGEKINCILWTSSLQLISGADNSFIQIWNPQPSQLNINFQENDQRVRRITWHPEGTHAASLLRGGNIQIWDLKNAQIHSTLHADPQTFDLVWINNNEIATLFDNITIWDWKKKKRNDEIDIETNKKEFKKWKSCAKVSTLHAVQTEEQRTLVMCDEGNMAYFPSAIQDAVCLETKYLIGRQQNYFYLFRIEKE